MIEHQPLDPWLCQVTDRIAQIRRMLRAMQQIEAMDLEVQTVGDAQRYLAMYEVLPGMCADAHMPVHAHAQDDVQPCMWCGWPRS